MPDVQVNRPIIEGEDSFLYLASQAMDMIRHLLGWVRYQDLIRLRQTSSKLQLLADSREVWHEKISRDFPYLFRKFDFTASALKWGPAFNVYFGVLRHHIQTSQMCFPTNRAPTRKLVLAAYTGEIEEIKNSNYDDLTKKNLYNDAAAHGYVENLNKAHCEYDRDGALCLAELRGFDRPQQALVQLEIDYLKSCSRLSAADQQKFLANAYVRHNPIIQFCLQKYEGQISDLARAELLKQTLFQNNPTLFCYLIENYYHAISWNDNLRVVLNNFFGSWFLTAQQRELTVSYVKFQTSFLPQITLRVETIKLLLTREGIGNYNKNNLLFALAKFNRLDLVEYSFKNCKAVFSPAYIQAAFQESIQQSLPMVRLFFEHFPTLSKENIYGRILSLTIVVLIIISGAVLLYFPIKDILLITQRSRAIETLIMTINFFTDEMVFINLVRQKIQLKMAFYKTLFFLMLFSMVASFIVLFVVTWARLIHWRLLIPAMGLLKPNPESYFPQRWLDLSLNRLAKFLLYAAESIKAFFDYSVVIYQATPPVLPRMQLLANAVYERMPAVFTPYRSSLKNPPPAAGEHNTAVVLYRSKPNV